MFNPLKGLTLNEEVEEKSMHTGLAFAMILPPPMTQTLPRRSRYTYDIRSLLHYYHIIIHSYTLERLRSGCNAASSHASRQEERVCHNPLPQYGHINPTTHKREQPHDPWAQGLPSLTDQPS